MHPAFPAHRVLQFSESVFLKSVFGRVVFLHQNGKRADPHTHNAGMTTALAAARGDIGRRTPCVGSQKALDREL